jgi:hypothetical protein
MNQLYTMIALDLARERVRDAEMERRASLARAGRPARPGLVRRGLATGFALVSRGSTAAARRLDRRVADDLGRALAAGK